MAILIRESEWGTTHPFIARMFVGILEIRDLTVMSSTDPRNRKVAPSHFDELYEPIRRSMQTLLKTASEINLLLTNYQTNIDNGEIIKFEGENIEVLKTIDEELNNEFGNILNLSIIISKSCLQRLLIEVYDIDIGFLYQSDRLFNEGINNLLNSNKGDLSTYLTKTRQTWLSEVNQLRINREHHNWLLGKTKFVGKPPFLHIIYPLVNEVPVNEYSRRIANRSVRFVEDLIAYGYQDLVYSPIKLLEINEEQRDKSCPKRFMAIPSISSENCWKIKYQEFFEFL